MSVLTLNWINAPDLGLAHIGCVEVKHVETYFLPLFLFALLSKYFCFYLLPYSFYFLLKMAYFILAPFCTVWKCYYVPWSTGVSVVILSVAVFVEEEAVIISDAVLVEEENDKAFDVSL